MSGGKSEASGYVEPEIGTRQGQGNFPEKDPSDPVRGGETLRDPHHQIFQLRPRICPHEGHLSMERSADGRRRRNRLRSAERALPETRLGESPSRITARCHTVRFRERLGEVHRLRQGVSFLITYSSLARSVWCNIIARRFSS